MSQKREMLFPENMGKDVQLRCEECLVNLNRRDAVSTLGSSLAGLFTGE
jgi:hypothetical protein